MKLLKKGQSTGFGFLLGLLLLFAIGILAIIFNGVFDDYIYPVTDTMLNASPYLNATELADINNVVTKGKLVWNIIPIFFLILIIVFMILNAMRNNKTDSM